MPCNSNSEQTCFICSSHSEITQEHIIPNWLQKLQKLHVQKYSLPNGEFKQYKGFKAPLCKLCNQQLSKNLEDKISTAFKKWFNEVLNLNKDLIFYWLLKIYYGSIVHSTQLLSNPKYPQLWYIFDIAMLKNKFSKMEQILKWSKNLTEFLWEKPYSLFIFKIWDWIGEYDQFDYWRLDYPSVIYMRYNDFWIICCLLDGWIIQNFFQKNSFFNISRNIHVLQFNEIIARIAYKFSTLKSTPHFLSVCDHGSNIPSTIVTLPSFSWKIYFNEWKMNGFKEYMKYIFSRYPVDLELDKNPEECGTFIDKWNNGYFSSEEIQDLIRNQ
jgi:hypothetical protein